MLSSIVQQFVGKNQFLQSDPALPAGPAATVCDPTDADRRLQCLREFTHDMRTPAASILVLGEKQLAQDQLDRQAVERIMDHARQLIQMMEGFLAQTRVQEAALYTSERLVQDLLDDSLEQVRDLADQRGVKIAWRQEGACYFVQVASDLMVRAFTNLLVNAIKYGEPGSTIDLRCRPLRHAGGWAVAIELDNRIATLPGHDHFALSGSCGMGLDFVRTVLSRHGGNLDLDLRSTGHARARITLPCEIELM